MDDDKDYQKSEFAKRVEELMDDGFEFGEAVKEAMKEGYKSGGPVGIEILFTEKVPAAPSQLVSESDIILGYRGDAAYRSGSLQSSSIGQGNVGSKASFGGGKGVDRSGRDEGAGGADRSKVTREQTRNQIKNQLGIKDPNLIQKTFDTYNRLPLPIKGAINTMAPVDLMKIFNIGNAINTGVNQIKNPDYNLEDMTLGMGDQPLPDDNLLAFEPGSKKDKQLKSLFKEKGLTEDLGIPFPAKKEKKLQELMKEDQEQTDFPKTELLKAKDGGRVGLFMGGPALTGQPLAIYNSMNAYGFSDQEIANAIKEAGYELPTADSGTTTPNIIGSQLNQGGGDTGIMELQETFTRAPGSTPKISEDAFFGLGKFLQGKEKGTLGTRLAKQPRLPLPASIAAYSMSPFNPDSKNYNPDLEDQLNFLELGDDMIGMSGTGLKYGSGSVLAGQNVISGFGSNNYLTQLNKFIAKTKSDRRRQQGIDERNAFLAAEEARKEKIAKEKQMADAAERARLERLGRDKDRGGFDPSGPTQASIRASREDRSGATGTKAGGFTNPGRGSYGPFMADGGLATMFRNKR